MDFRSQRCRQWFQIPSSIYLRLFGRFSGWRGTLKLLCLLSWLLAIPTLGVSIYLWIHGGITGKSITVVTIRSGPCESIVSADTWIHLVMNVLSSSLLAATNFAMQAWAAPTRSNIDKIHSTGETIDIGIPSFLNVVRAKSTGIILSATMFLIALPLHFVFNSAVYKTASMSHYNFTLTTPEYARRTFTRLANGSNLYTNLRDPRINNEWEELTLEELQRRYQTELPSTFRHAVVVWDHFEDVNDTIISHRTQVPAEFQTPITEPMDNLSGETKFVWIEYEEQEYPLKVTGFSEKFKPECRLLANPLFWWLTAVCNLTIACSITGLVYFYKSTPLVTVGDATDSFLSRPSEYITKSACTYGHTVFGNMFRPSLVARPFTQDKRRGWWQAVGLTRWWYTTLWFSFIIFALVSALIADFSLRDPHEMFTSDLGSASKNVTNVIMRLENPRPAMNQFQLVALANTPQFITSLTYIYYNIVLTTMVSEREWQRLGQKETPSSSCLRVSTPRGRQRSSYFLSLPYRYGIPLLIMTTVEKWFASLGLFYIVLDIWDTEGVRVSDDLGTGSIGELGYSSLAILILIILTAVSWVAILFLGMVRSHPAGKPLLGSCSGVIAASCHLSAADCAKRDAGEDVAAGPLSWGVIKQVNEDGEEEQWLGFMTGEEAETPKDGEVYG